MILAASSSGAVAGGVILLLILVAIGFCLYFLPSFIASRRHHHQFGTILVLNIFLGWTFIGWVVCLAMSLSATYAGGSPVSHTQATPPGWYPQPTPANPSQTRWWDGTQWTEHTQG